MRFLPIVLSLSFLLQPGSPSAAATPDEASVEAAKDGVRRLFEDLNAAVAARDRAALERLIAEEMVWVHARGYVDDRAAYLEDSLSQEGGRPISVPTFEPPARFHVYGDVAVLDRPRPPDGARPGFWSTAIYVRRDGRWQLAHLQGTLLQPERPVHPVAAEALAAYAGRYRQPAGKTTEIVLRDGALVARHPGLPERVLTPVAEDRFFDKVGSEWTFVRDAEGTVHGYHLRLPEGTEVRAERSAAEGG